MSPWIMRISCAPSFPETQCSISSTVSLSSRRTTSHTVEDHFKQMLRENDCLQAMRVAKTMRERIAEQESKRHIPSSMYTRLYDQAVGLVLSEFSAALDMPEDEVMRIMHESDPDALARMA